MSVDIETGTEIAVAFLGGLVSGIAIITAQGLRQWWIDHRSAWPFDVNVRALKPPLEGTRTYEVRVRAFNRSSTQAYINPEPRDAAGHGVGGWNVRSPWTPTAGGVFMPVGPRSATEFWIDGNLLEGTQLPTHLHLFASFCTFWKGRETTVPIDFSKSLGEE